MDKEKYGMCEKDRLYKLLLENLTLRYVETEPFSYDELEILFDGKPVCKEVLPKLIKEEDEQRQNTI